MTMASRTVRSGSFTTLTRQIMIRMAMDCLTFGKLIMASTLTMPKVIRVAQEIQMMILLPMNWSSNWELIRESGIR